MSMEKKLHVAVAKEGQEVCQGLICIFLPFLGKNDVHDMLSFEGCFPLVVVTPSSVTALEPGGFAMCV